MRFFIYTTTLVFCSLSFGQETIHCWDFNGTNPFTASPLNTDNRVIGDGAISHNITNVGAFAGNINNACEGSAAGNAFCPQGGVGIANNGSNITLSFSSLGYQDLVLSFWARRTATGFDNNTVQYSLNSGGTYTDLTTFSPPNTAGGQLFTFDFSALVDANNNPDFRIRILLNGATDPNGNNRYDNIKLVGTIATINLITIDAVSSLTYDVDCEIPATGTTDISSVGTFNAGNSFIVQLSNSVGDFTSPVQIGELNGTLAEGVDPSGTIDFSIPSGIAGGTGYRIRILSTEPASVSTDNGVDITINSEICPTALPASEGLLINEWSNGPDNNKEYYEFIVAGNCGDIVDVRGYIIDDNNGTFTDYNVADPINGESPTGSGVAQGHMRLTNHPQWASIPVGSLIVVYNNGDKNSSLPSDDPYDSDGDYLYVIPHDFDELFEITTSIPNAADPDSTYSPATYGSDSWGPLGLANAQDAVQVRTPEGIYFHGVSYGGDVMTGGPNNMKIFNGSTTNMCGWFNSGDYLDANNWALGGMEFETPGLPNNSENAAWLAAMRDPLSEVCPVVALPITLGDFKGAYDGKNNHLKWYTYSEQNNDYFKLFHSTDGKVFSELGRVEGNGTTTTSMYYEFFHRNPPSGMNYYKLKSVDYDGTVHQKGIIAVVVETNHAFYDQMTQQIILDKKGDYSVFNSTGQLITRVEGQQQIPFTHQGIFLIVNEQTGKSSKIAAY